MNLGDVPTVDVDEVGADAVLLDVREDDEWAAGHIDAALHIPMRQLPATLATAPATLPADQRVVVVCAVGARSAQVTAWLNQQGYDAANLAGGMHAWAHAGRPMSSDTAAPPMVI